MYYKLTMKLPFLLSLLPLLSFAAGPISPATNGPIKVVFSWFPDPALMGGMSTNDYMTNIVGFRIWSTPTLVPQVWTIVTNLPPAIGTNSWVLPSNTNTTFYAATTVGVSGESPFSNTAVWIALPGGGTLNIFKGP